MSSLELKIPPLILVAIFAVIMWPLSSDMKIDILPQSVNLIVAVIILLMGLTVAMAGVFSFKESDTTVNPTTPQKATFLVTTGVYQFTRNPMYLGFFLFLVSWAVYLSSLVSLVMPVFYVLYMNKFQIIPEEKILNSIFGEEFDVYKKRVRRWL